MRITHLCHSSPGKDAAGVVVGFFLKAVSPEEDLQSQIKLISERH